MSGNGAYRGQAALISPPDLSRTLFWEAEGGISARQIVARAAALAERLPERGAAVVFHERRDYFVAALIAAWSSGATAVLPAGSGARDLEGILGGSDGAYCLSEQPLRQLPDIPVFIGAAPCAGGAGAWIPSLPMDATAIRIFTSGSTGVPTGNDKSWATLAAAAAPTARMIGLDRLSAPSIVATVPSNHMYGLELTVLQVLQAGASVHVERPAYPADIARCLGESPSPRVLVTTPFHLRGLMESDIALPPVARVISATAPMSEAFALAAERRIGAPVHEIYGFTEIGSVATREPARQSDWSMREDLLAVSDGGVAVAACRSSADRMPFPDVVEIVDERRIRLLGRSRDIVKVAGKRASLPGLSAELTRIPGVEDGVLILTAEDEGRGLVSRLAAFVVAPSLSAAQIRDELRRFIDPAFMPRYVFHVPSLPRNETGKLRQDDLQKLAAVKLFRDEPL